MSCFPTSRQSPFHTMDLPQVELKELLIRWWYEVNNHSKEEHPAVNLLSLAFSHLGGQRGSGSLTVKGYGCGSRATENSFLLSLLSGT